ncbi:MAG: T9SS type A sorting domain-containing protein [Bacteroidetes bacterium]|nr:T9SS type A sorting domain-containing protein [Bacteroidota bacterium]
MKSLLVLLICCITNLGAFAQCDNLLKLNTIQHCQSDPGSLQLDSLVKDLTGSWTLGGKPVNSKIIALSNLKKDTAYLYTIPNPKPNCPNSDTFTIRINPLPRVDVLPLQPLCEDFGKLDLRTYCSPAHYTGRGGVWADADSLKYIIDKEGNNWKFDSRVAGTMNGVTTKHTVYYTYTDNNGCKNTDSGIINVKPLPLISLYRDSINMNLNQKPLVLDYFVKSPKGGSWSWPGQPTGLNSVYMTDTNNDSKTEWVFNPTGVYMGEKTLVYYFKDKLTECDNTAEFKILLDTISQTVGIKNAPERNEIQIYPNPNNGHFTITASADGAISIFNFNGQKVREEKLQEGNNEIEISLPEGIYMVQNISNNVESTTKISVVR